MAKLPLELTAEVLCRLPAKSIARFSSVSKDWASVFSDPYFSRLHCHRQEQNLRLIVRDGHLYSLDMDSLDCALRVDHLLEDSNFTVKRVLGLSNGLVCLSVSSPDTNPNPNPVVQKDEDGWPLLCTPELNDDIIVICNLSTGARRIVPPASVDFGIMYMPEQLERRFSYGFAFDPSANDYKLIRISQYVYFQFADASPPEMLCEVMVYSMATNSWTRVDLQEDSFMATNSWNQQQDSSIFCIASFQEPVLVDGAFHWVAGELDFMNCKDYDRPTTIIAFNLADATFREVPHITSELDLLKLNLGEAVREINKDRILKLSLGVVGGRLCVVCLHFSLNYKVVIWKLGGTRDARSWEPLATFSRDPADKELCLWMALWFSKDWVYGNSVFSNSGDQVLVDHEDKLICCDLTKETADVSQIKFITMQPSKKKRKIAD